MRIVVIYREYSDHARECDEWIHEFEKRSNKELEILDPDSPEGETFCMARDIGEYPAIVVADSDGKTYEIWTGTPLPVIDEVAAYTV